MHQLFTCPVIVLPLAAYTSFSTINNITPSGGSSFGCDAPPIHCPPYHADQKLPFLTPSPGQMANVGTLPIRFQLFGTIA